MTKRIAPFVHDAFNVQVAFRDVMPPGNQSAAAIYLFPVDTLYNQRLVNGELTVYDVAVAFVAIALKNILFDETDDTVVLVIVLPDRGLLKLTCVVGVPFLIPVYTNNAPAALYVAFAFVKVIVTVLPVVSAVVMYPRTNAQPCPLYFVCTSR